MSWVEYDMLEQIKARQGRLKSLSGLDKATVIGGGSITDDGDIAFTRDVKPVVASNNAYDIFGDVGVGQQFLPEFTRDITALKDLKVRVARIGTPSDLTAILFDVTANQVLETVDISTFTIPTGATMITIPFSYPIALVPGHELELRFHIRAWSGAVGTNYRIYYRSSSNAIEDSSYLFTNDRWVTSTEFTDRDLAIEAVFEEQILTVDVNLEIPDIDPFSLEPATFDSTGDVALSVRNANGDVLLDGVSSGDSLAAANTMNHRPISLVWTMSRESRDDPPPTLSDVVISWIGATTGESLSDKTPLFKWGILTAHYSYTVFDISGSGYLVTAGLTSSGASIALQIDGGDILQFSFETPSVALFPLRFSSSLKITISSSSSQYPRVAILLD